MPNPKTRTTEVTTLTGSYGNTNKETADAKADQRIKRVFSPSGQAELYDGVAKHKSEHPKLINEYIKKNPGVQDPGPTGDKARFFFRDQLKARLDKLEAKDGKNEVGTLNDLLGKEIAELYKLARLEERFEEQYIRAVTVKSLETVAGPKWANRPIIPLFGPSGGGKSYVKQAVLEEANDCIPKATEKADTSPTSNTNTTGQSNTSLPSDVDTENTAVFSDGGIEREVSEVRKLMVAFAVKNHYKDISDLDDLPSGKLKKNILNAATLSKDVGIVLVDTASKYKYGKRYGDVGVAIGNIKPVVGGGQLALIQKLAKDEHNVIIPVSIIAEDLATMRQTVKTMANARSQANDNHFEMMDQIKVIDVSKLPKGLPELKKYDPDEFMSGVDGSAVGIKKTQGLSQDNSAIFAVHDLMLQKIDSKGALVNSTESTPAPIIVSSRLVKAWNSKTEVARLEAGFEAYCSTSKTKAADRISIIKQGDKWVKTGLATPGAIYVDEVKFDDYQNLISGAGFRAYCQASDEMKSGAIPVTIKGGKWVKHNYTSDIVTKDTLIVFVNEDKFDHYQAFSSDKKNDAEFKEYTALRETDIQSAMLDAYISKHSKPLLHTSGELALFRIKNVIEEELKNVKKSSSDQEAALKQILGHMDALQIGGTDVENTKKLNRAKDYPVLLDAFEQTMRESNKHISKEMQETIFQALNQIKGEVRHRQKVAGLITEQQAKLETAIDKLEIPEASSIKAAAKGINEECKKTSPDEYKTKIEQLQKTIENLYTNTNNLSSKAKAQIQEVYQALQQTRNTLAKSGGLSQAAPTNTASARSFIVKEDDNTNSVKFHYKKISSAEATTVDATLSSPTTVPTLQQQGATNITYKAVSLKEGELIQFSANLGEPGTADNVAIITLDHKGKVSDLTKSQSMSPQDNAVRAIEQAKIMLTNYDPKLGAILLTGNDKEQSNRVLAALLMLKPNNDVKIKSLVAGCDVPSAMLQSRAEKAFIKAHLPPDLINENLLKTEKKEVSDIRSKTNDFRSRMNELKGKGQEPHAPDLDSKITLS